MCHSVLRCWICVPRTKGENSTVRVVLTTQIVMLDIQDILYYHRSIWSGAWSDSLLSLYDSVISSTLIFGFLVNLPGRLILAWYGGNHRN